MAGAYRTYCRAAAAVFLLIAVATVSTKLARGRLATDWLHSRLHLGSALLGAVAGWDRPSARPARWFTWGIGLLYGGAGVLGRLIAGSLLDTRAALPLGPADDRFHLARPVPAPALIARDGARSARTAPPASRAPS